ncbi:MAG: hypothetical protein P1U83_12210 [Roseovarius sp.]|nr:hypothetical protein [Roseovarius sp.]
MPTPDVMTAAGAAAGAARAAAYAAGAAGAAADAADAAAYAADAAARAAARAAAYAAGAARAAAYAADAAAGAAARAADFKDTDILLDLLFETPVWHDPGEPDWLVSVLMPKDNLLESGPEWAFWREWYYGFLNGKPLNWELQKRVTLIEDAIWEDGPEAVALEIERIRAAFDVETQAADLEENSSTAIASIRGIGDNNPPAPIEDASVSTADVTIIWAAARDIREEAQSEVPNKARIGKAVGALVGALKACGVWGAQKVDIGLNAAVVAVGAASGTAGVAWVTQNGDKIAELIEAVERWIKLF